MERTFLSPVEYSLPTLFEHKLYTPRSTLIYRKRLHPVIALWLRMHVYLSFFLRSAPIPFHLFPLGFFLLFFLMPSLALGEKGCDWQIDYKGRKYKVFSIHHNTPPHIPPSPAQEILSAVPESREHLKNIESNNRKKKVHTILSSVGVLALLGSHLLREIGNNDYNRTNVAIDIGSAVFILQGIFFNKRLQRKNEKEIQLAVEAFNREHKEKTISLTKGGK